MPAEGISCTYSELRGQVARLAGALREFGVAKGDPVQMMLDRMWEIDPLNPEERSRRISVSPIAATRQVRSAPRSIVPLGSPPLTLDETLFF